MRKWLALLMFLAATASAQSQAEPSQSSASSAAPQSHAVDENEHFRVERFDFDGKSQIDLPRHRPDAIIVSLGQDLALSSPKSNRAEALANGDVRFLGQRADSTIIHTDDGQSQFLVIELKHHWDAEIRPCVETKACTHVVRIGGFEIGTSTSLFTNGFVTAYRDQIGKGGTLATSYYSAKGKHHLMFVALDDLHANFDGTEHDLKPGQVVASDAAEVEVDAGSHEARWIVIRIEGPKDQEQK